MELKKTISSIFMVPTLKIDRRKLREHEFINAYCKDIKSDEHYENCIYLLFKPKDMDKFYEFVDSEHERTSSIIKDYEYNGGFVILVYKLDSKFNKDFDLIRQGKYSKVSDKFKEKFDKTIRVVKKSEGRYQEKEEQTLQWKVFTKSDDLREYWEKKIGHSLKDDMETWPIWEEENEILDIEKVKMLYEQKSDSNV